ncbi:phosphodiester glycosidase family protein [Candidatus Uhrbacteria bacterium]|nr:phosphodiester glycosidase family protein [Candidatus Uhrbacteria bacterium]
MSFGFGCTPASTKMPISHTPVLKQQDWAMIANGIQQKSVSLSSPQTGHLLLTAFDPKQFDFRFAYSTSSKTVTEWHQVFSSAVAVFNGSYFHEDKTPSGDLITQGKDASSRAFDLDKSAVLELAPQFRIVDTLNQPFDAAASQEAAQSFPMLVRRGQSAVLEDSGKTARRTFVGVRNDGWAVFGVLADSELSLFQLSQKLSQTDLQMQTALNLDGGPSTGYSFTAGNIEQVANSFTQVPISIIVDQKK